MLSAVILMFVIVDFAEITEVDPSGQSQCMDSMI